MTPDNLTWRKTGRAVSKVHSEPLELAQTNGKERRFYRVRAGMIEVARHDA
jgi:hypothetical protein